MTQFVEECLREWKRLDVPDAVANEMAAELEADLSDATADGLSPEELLGDGVFDARSFAATWAAERGVVPSPPAPAPRSRRTLIAAVTGALAVVTLFAGIAVLTATPTKQVTIASPFRVAVHRLVKPATGGPAVPRFFITPVHGKVVFPAKPIPAGLVRSGIDLQPVGWILVAIGIAGVAGSLFWLRVPLRRRYTTA